MISTLTDTDIEELKNITSNNSLLNHIVNNLSLITNTNLRKHIVNYLYILNSEKINYLSLCNLTSNGIPNELKSLRSLIWKILFRNLSLNNSKWKFDLTISRDKYNNYIQQYIINPKQSKNFLSLKEHPLSLNENSIWHKYFSDINLNKEILKDIRRTRTHMEFFLKPFKKQPYNKDNNTYSIQEECVTNADIMNRILFIYGKVHPEVNYVQGMNELLAPIFYCYSEDTNEDNCNYVEADVFTSFENLMEEIKDIFMRSKDKTEQGIEKKMYILEELIKYYDYEIYAKLKKENIEMHFFAFKWMTLFFSQDYEIWDILRLWDTIMAQENKFEIVYMLILAILKIKKEDIFNNENPGVLMVFQDITDISIDTLLNESKVVKENLMKKMKVIKIE